MNTNGQFLRDVFNLPWMNYIVSILVLILLYSNIAIRLRDLLLS